MRRKKTENGGSDVFVKVSNQEVWNQFKEFQISNDKGHAEILKKIQELDDKVTFRIDGIEKLNSIEHEKIKGSINLVSMTIGGIITIGAIAINWIVANLK